MITSVLASILTLANAPSPSCVTQVSTHFSAQRFAAAAAAGEQCWSQEKKADALFYATQARINLGHGAHAALDLRRFIAATTDGAQAAVPWARQQIHGLVVVVVVEFEPPAIASRTLQARFLDQDRGLLLVELDELPTGAQGRELALDPGLWEIKLFHGPKLVAEATIEAKEGASVTLAQPLVDEDQAEVVSPSLETPTVDFPGRRSHRARVFGIGGAAVVSAAAGIGLMASAAKEPAAPDPSASSPRKEEVLGDWLDRANRTCIGASLLGGGVGSGIVVATELARAKPRAYVAEAAAGGALALGGAIYAGLSMTSYDRGVMDGQTLDRDFFRSRYGHEITSGMLLGLGTGLLSSAAVSLITRAIADRRRRSTKETRR